MATLNDEQDWRNGMRVKPLKHMVLYLISLAFFKLIVFYSQCSFQLQSKHGQRKQHWRGPEPDKNSSGRIADQNGPNKNIPVRVTDQNGDEEIPNVVNEHHDGVPDEEVNLALVLSISGCFLLGTHFDQNLFLSSRHVLVILFQLPLQENGCCD